MCVIAVTVATSSLAVIGKAVAPARNGHVKNLLPDLQRKSSLQILYGDHHKTTNIPLRKTISTYETAIKNTTSLSIPYYEWVTPTKNMRGANSPPPGDRRSTKTQATERVLTTTSDRREYTKDAPAGELLHLQEQSRDNQEGEGGGARKEKRWRISKGASICCAGTHITKTFCVREQRVPRIFQSNSQAPAQHNPHCHQ